MARTNESKTGERENRESVFGVSHMNLHSRELSFPLFFNPHTTSLISDLSLCIIADNLTSVVQTSERGIHVHICHVYHLFMPGRKATPRVSTRSLGVVGLTDLKSHL